MPNELTASKAEFKLDLVAAGLNVVEYVPERVIPPVVIINSASPYIVTTEFSGEYDMAIDLVLVAANATNKQATEKLDDLIEATLNAIAPISYAKFDQVQQPYNLAVNNAEYLSTTIQVKLAITI